MSSPDRQSAGLGLWLLVLILTLVAGQAPAQPEDPIQTVIEEVNTDYRNGRLDRAELTALRLLNRPDLVDFQRAELYRILAFTSVARDDTELALTYFRSALDANPNLRLDRRLTSPKILSVFDQARVNFTQVRILDRETLVTDLKISHLKIGGGSRSLLLPGLGQLYKGQPLRGNLFIGTSGVAFLGLVYTQVMVMDAQDRYDRSETPGSATRNYNDLVKYWEWRNGFAYSLGGIYVISALDAFFSPPNPSAYDRIRIEMAYDPVSNVPMAGLAFQF